MHLKSSLVFATLMLLSSTLVSAHNIDLPKSLEDLELTKISPRIYVIHGMQALPDKNNKGFISNTGILLTETGVVIIDSGGSAEVGRLIVSRVRELTTKPIIAVINTHVHGDHWLGNIAILEAFPDVNIYAHERAIERLKNGDAEQWIEIIMSMTEGVYSDNALPIPKHGLNGGEQLEIGSVTLKTHHTGHAHTDSDIMVEVMQERLLFTGDIIEFGRAVSSDVPQDFDIKGQIEAIRYAINLPVDTFVPGHGITGGKEVPEASMRFLEILYRSVKRHYDKGLEDYEMRELVANDLNEFANWFGYDQLGRLISFVYQQVEEAAF